MKRILTSLVLVASVYSFAQVSISGEADDTPQATLDIQAFSKDTKTNGILVPRLSKTEADNMTKPDMKSGGGKESSIVESTLIYINDVSGNATNYATNVDANGFYYFKDGKWVKLGSGSSQTWSQFRTKKNTKTPSDKSKPYVGSNGGIYQVSSDNELIPDTAFFVIITLKGNVSVRLPKAKESDAGRIIVLSNTTEDSKVVYDYQGKTGSEPDTQLRGDGTIFKYRGKMFITDGIGWYPIAY